MGQVLPKDETVCRLSFVGKMTIEFADELEDKIIAAVRRFRYLEVDLSGVHEIDHCGIHLLGLLETLGGKDVVIVASSQVVEQARRRQRTSFYGASLARVARRECA